MKDYFKKLIILILRLYAEMKHCVAQYCGRCFLAETIKRIYEGNVYILCMRQTQNKNEADLSCWAKAEIKPFLFLYRFAQHCAFDPVPICQMRIAGPTT